MNFANLKTLSREQQLQAWFKIKPKLSTYAERKKSLWQVKASNRIVYFGFNKSEADKLYREAREPKHIFECSPGLNYKTNASGWLKWYFTVLGLRSLTT